MRLMKLKIISSFGLLLLVALTSYSQQTTLVIPKSADISVINVQLLHRESTESILGAEIKIIESESDFPKAYFFNEQEDQLLTFVVFPGSKKNNISQFIIEQHTNMEISNIPSIAGVRDIITGKGIRVGQKPEQIIKILGKPDQSILKGNIQIIKYSIENYSSSELLKFYNFPAYIGEYTFENSKLVKIWFGFIYP